MPTFCNNLARKDVVVGILSAIGVYGATSAFSLTLLNSELSQKVGFFSAKYESRRKAVRDILRNGKYKPSGRGKPASEYLVSLIERGEPLPSINPLVDIFNYTSARFQIPISVWSPRQLSADSYTFALGRPGDAYQFNSSGHVIEVKDLIVGAMIRNDESVSFLSPVKDAHIAKVDSTANHIAAAFYVPVSEAEEMEAMFDCVRRLLHEAAPACDIIAEQLASGDQLRIEHTVSQN
jgi:DNA/RNA-binding domain of Phe-tRNA-synthetase-like protein